MILLIIDILGLIASLPIIVLFHFIMIKKDKKNNIKMATHHIVGVYVFCIAVVSVLSITRVPNLYHLSVNFNINLVPFSDIFTNFLQYILNIILFIPVGFLLPTLWTKFEQKRSVFLFGFFFSLSIEIMQIFNNRITDIDDLLMNTLGTAFGYLLFLLIRKFFPKISKFAINRSDLWKWESYVCFCSAWLSILVIEVSSWLLSPVIM